MPAFRSALALVVTVVVVATCNFDWDTFDPRLVETAGTTSSGGGQGGAAASSASSTAVSAVSTGGTGGVGGAGGTGGAPTVTLEYQPTVADCIYDAIFDPDQCRSTEGAVWVDTTCGVMNLDVAHAYLRFDLDGQLNGLSVIDVRLELTFSTAGGSRSVETHELWEVMPFARSDLFNGLVPTVGMLGATQVGTFVSLDVVSWPLPTGIVAANGSVYLSLEPVGGDGAGYFGIGDATPPKLIITAQ